jgi:hypothetical protein
MPILAKIEVQKSQVHEADGIGWGYYDAINDTLEDAFPEDM